MSDSYFCCFGRKLLSTSGEFCGSRFSAAKFSKINIMFITGIFHKYVRWRTFEINIFYYFKYSINDYSNFVSVLVFTGNVLRRALCNYSKCIIYGIFHDEKEKFSFPPNWKFYRWVVFLFSLFSKHIFMYKAARYRLSCSFFSRKIGSWPQKRIFGN